MGRRRRKIESKQCYEVCFRAKEGLPLVAYHCINLIIGAILARAQRDNKVTICHDIWNGSHAHLILVPYDAEKFFRFLSEVQKQITEAIKRLLGIDYLNLWEGEPMVAQVLDLNAAIERLSYLYANPAQDDLVDGIEKFPGFSSWSDFEASGNVVEAEVVRKYPWIRRPSIPQLDFPILTKEQDIKVVRHLLKQNNKIHTLSRRPNWWMKSFGISTDEEAAAINQRVLERLRKREEAARTKRKKEGRAVMGVERMTSQQILKPHKPKRRERKIFCLSSVKKLRVAFIAQFKIFCKQCRECYQRARDGETLVEWPPGAFRPPIRPLYNILPSTEAGHFAYL